MEFLHSRKRPYLIVATKSDRMSGNSLSQAMRTLSHEYAGAAIIAFSAKTGIGKEEIWKQIRASAERLTTC